MLFLQVYVQKRDEKPYWNRKSRKSINAMICAGMTGIIYAIEADSTGSQHDSVALERSILYQRFMHDHWIPFEGSYLAADLGYRVCFMRALNAQRQL